MSTTIKSNNAIELSISGHQVRLTFASEQNPTVAQQIRASLIDSYIRQRRNSDGQSAEGVALLENQDTALPMVRGTTFSFVKGYTTADGMTEDGDAAFVETYTVSAMDANTYAVDSYSGAPVSNLFDHARGDISYLTRNDWTGTFPVHDGEPSDIVSTWGGEINDSDGVAYTWKKAASAALIAQLDAFDSNSPVDPASFTEYPGVRCEERPDPH